MRRKLPVFVERSIQQLQADRMGLAHSFEAGITGTQILSCHAGCSSCCYHPVHISILEAFPLYGALVERGLWTPSFKEKLKASSDMTSGLSFQVWLLSKLACPLLDDDKRCSVYEERPLVCRATLATGDPYFCDPQRLGAETSIVPRKEVVEEFHAREKALLRKHGLHHLTMPIGRAILMAERVCSGSLTLENVDRTYFADHLADEA